MLMILLAAFAAQAGVLTEGMLLVCEGNQKKLVVEVIDTKAQNVHIQYFSEGKLYVDGVTAYAESGFGIDIALVRRPPFQALIDADLKHARVPRSGVPFPCLLSQPVER